MSKDETLQQQVCKGKKFYFSQDELTNLNGRMNVLKNWDYTIELLKEGIQRDMQGYINEVVKPRLKIPKEALVKVDIKAGTLEIDTEVKK